jgi:hypothetical protein
LLKPWRPPAGDRRKVTVTHPQKPWKQFSELRPNMTRMVRDKKGVMVGSNTPHAPLWLVQNTGETNRTDEESRQSPRA